MKSDAKGGRRPGRRLVVVTAILAVLGIAAVLAVESIRWRVHTLALVATGRVQDVSVRETIDFMHPASGQQRIGFLRESRNPYAVLHVPDDALSEAGGELFRNQCAPCHGPSGGGGPLAPALFGRAFLHGESDWAVYRTIRNGVPATAMAPNASLTPDQIWSLVAQVRAFQGAAGGEVAAPAMPSPAANVNVSPEELLQVKEPGEDWLTYSGSYAALRRSSLSEITPQNVNQLALRWMRSVAPVGPMVQSPPLVRRGVMYLTSPPGTVLALDARNGHVLWTYQHDYSKREGGDAGVGANRGVALLNDVIYYGAWDAQLVALSAATGKVLWKAQVAEHPRAHISSAPLALKDLVMVGVGTMPGGGRGVVAAFDARTGKERWRFDAIPGEGVPGNDTWAGESWKEGGAPTWLTGTYDPDTDIVYWGVGNPKPDYRTEVRKGDNLYSNSVVALQADTGKLIWHFQFTPADDHDWDSNQTPLLADLPSAVGVQKALLLANRNAFYYVLDRVTGRFITGVPFARQNWASGLDADGRPIRSLDEFRREGNLVFPGTSGATNWWSPSVDIERNLAFIPVIEHGMIFTPQEVPRDSGNPFYTSIRALEPASGRLVWERRFPPRKTDPYVGGILTTRTGVLFSTDVTRFFALDSASGKTLWEVETGNSIRSAPVTFAVDGKQFVSITAGNELMTFALPPKGSPGP